MDYCFMNLRPAKEGLGWEPDFPEGVDSLLLADCRPAKWALYEFRRNVATEDWKPESPIGDELVALLESGKKFPPSLRGRVLKVCVVILALSMVFTLALFRIYGVDTHHKGRHSIWWPERGRNLIPPTATDITLQRDLLDHYATYTTSEQDLNAFLDERFTILYKRRAEGVERTR